MYDHLDLPGEIVHFEPGNGAEIAREIWSKPHLYFRLENLRRRVPSAQSFGEDALPPEPPEADVLRPRQSRRIKPGRPLGRDLSREMASSGQPQPSWLGQGWRGASSLPYGA